MKYQNMQNTMQKWIAGGMKGSPPHSQDQLQDAAQACISDAARAAEKGASLISKPVQNTGSILKGFGG